MDSDSNHSDNILCTDSDFHNRVKPRDTAELPQTSSTEETKSNLQESFSTQVLEYYKHSAGQEVVSQTLQSPSISPEATGSLNVDHGSGQQAAGVGLGPQSDLNDVGLGLGLGLSADEIIAVGLPRQNIPKHGSILPEPGSVCSDMPNLDVGLELNIPRERKKWVKPPLFEHTSGSDDAFDGHLFSEQNSMDYQRNFAGRHIGQRTGDKHHFKPLDLGPAHHTQLVDNCLQISSNEGLPNINVMEDGTVIEHEGSNESQPKSPLDISLDASGQRASSPSSSIASNKRGLEWDSGADVGYHYQAKAGAQAHQISTFERIALARGSRAYQLTSDIKTCILSNSQPPAIQTTQSFKKLEHPQMTETQKGREMPKNYKDGDTSKLKSYQRTEEKVQTFPPKHVSDVKAYVPLHNTLSGLELYKLVSDDVSSKVTPPPPLVREGVSTETSDEELTLKQDSHREYKSLHGPLAQSTPLDLKENKTKAQLYIETTQEAEGVNGHNDNRESSYFSKKFSHLTTEISFISQESEGVGKVCDLYESSNRKEQSYGKENASSRPTSLLLGGNVQTPDRPTAQIASDNNSPKLVKSTYFPPLEPETIGDENAHSPNQEKPKYVFCVEEIEELIQNIQRKANKHQAHIDKFVKQTHSHQIIPYTFPRTRREESLSRNSSTCEWAQSRDQEDPINNPTSQQSCSMKSRGANKKGSNRSESTNSVSPCISPQLNEDGSCSSVSSCYFSDAPQSGNVANERGTVGSTGSFEYLPGHVYEKTNIKNLNAQSKTQVQRRSGSDSLNRKRNSLEEDLKIWAQLCQDDVIKTKDVVNQIVHTNYLEDEQEEETSEIPLQTGCSGSESGQSEKPFNIDELSAVNLTPKYCDKGTQIETVFSTASSDVESNTSSRRPSLYKKEEPSDRACDGTEDSSRPSSCTHGIAKGSSASTFSSAGYNTSTSRSFSNGEAGDWRKPATQSEQEFESRDMSSKKHKAKHAGTQQERLAIIDTKINHLNNLKMILERQDKLKYNLKMDSAKIDSVPVPKHHSVYTVMTATVNRQSEENDENETETKELHQPSERTPPSESLLEGQSDSVINWSSHHHLISRNKPTREISTQVPSSVSLKVLKEHNTNGRPTSSKQIKEDLDENKLTERKREICTQTPSDFDVSKSSDTDSIACRTNQGRINVYVQTVEEGSKNKHKKPVKINTTEQMCCCQCEENLLIIKEKTGTVGINAKQSYSTDSCPVSCNCNCHHKHKSSSLPKSGHHLNDVPISVSKSPEPRKKNIVPVTVTCNCKKLCASTPVSSSSTYNGSTCHHHHNDILKNSTLQQVYYQTPIRPISDSLATPTSPVENPRNAMRSTATSTVDNKGVQTSDSVSQLPIIRPLWFSTANSHVKIRGKKCVCCSHQPVKKLSQDSKVIFEDTVPLQKSSKYRSSSCSENVRCQQKSHKSSSYSDDVRCPHKPNSATYNSSSSRHEDVRCPHRSTYKSGSRSEDVRCPHLSSTCKSSSSHVEDVILRCQKCRRDIQICHCKSVKTSITTGTSEDSWDISALGASTGSKSENIESVVTPRSIGYLLTFETVPADQSSSSETIRKRSLQEVKVKIPAAKPTALHKNHRRAHHKKEKANSKTNDILPQENSFQEVRAQIPSRKSHAHREEKPTEILNSNQLADNLGETDSKSDSLEEIAMKSSQEKQNRHNRSHTSRLTLQDYLRQARPDYIRMAEARRRCLAELADLRLLRHENRQRLLALASQPGSTIDTETLSSANSMLPPPPMAIKRVFNQRVMRKQTERGYQKCPEVMNKKVDRKRKEDYRTNRLMAEIFTKKLQRKALHGDVNLSNSVSVISML